MPDFLGLSQDQLDLILHPDKEQEWIEALLTVPSEDRGLVRWVATEQQHRILETTKRIKKLVIIKGRQTRCSTILLAKAVRQATTTYGGNYVIITQTNDMTQNFRQFIQDRLQDLSDNGLEYEIDTNNEKVLRLARMKSTFHFASAEQKVGLRGIQTAHWVHASEVAHWPEDSAKRIIGGLLPASPPNGTFILESTPNGAAGQFYEKAMDAIAEPGMPWTVQFYPWWLEKKYSIEAYEETLRDAGVDPDQLRFAFIPTAEEETLMARADLNANQILWRRMRARDLLSTGAYFAQEYPEDLMSCWLAAGICFFHDDNMDHLDYYRSMCIPPARKLSELDYQDPVTGLVSPVHLIGPSLHVWEEPKPGRKYVAFQDTSAGIQVGGDYSALVVADVTQGIRHVATLRVRVLPDRVGEMAAAVCRWYNWAFLGVERNTYGLMAITRLQALHYPNLYYDVINQPTKPEVGWQTSEGSRSLMLNRLRATVLEHNLQLRDQVAVLEMGGFTWHHVQGRSGAGSWKAEAERGNDDMVMALAGLVTIAPYAPNRVKSGRTTFYTGAAPKTNGDIMVGAGGVVLTQDLDSGHKPWLI